MMSTISNEAIIAAKVIESHTGQKSGWRKSLYHLVEETDEGSIWNKIVSWLIMGLIVASIVLIVAESFESVAVSFKQQLFYFELVSVIVFSTEYLIRILTADFLFPEESPLKARLKYMRSGMAVIDLLAILPFYLPFLITMDTRFVRTLRLLRLFRIFKLGRYSKSLKMMADVLKEKAGDLLIALFVTLLLLTVASILMYYVEHDVQPEIFPNIVATFWWAIATLTTVGYGDVYPVTGLGKLISGIIAILGIGMVALPTGIISSAFVDKITEARKAKAREEAKSNPKSICFCPQCGVNLER